MAQLMEEYMKTYGKDQMHAIDDAKKRVLACLVIGKKIKTLLAIEGPQTLHQLLESSIFPLYDSFPQFQHFWDCIETWLRKSVIDRLHRPENYQQEEYLQTRVSVRDINVSTLGEMANTEAERTHINEMLLNLFEYIRSESRALSEVLAYADQLTLEKKRKEKILFWLYDSIRRKIRNTCPQTNAVHSMRELTHST